MGTPRTGPGLLPAPAPGPSWSVSSPRNCRHPWTTWPETAPASNATPMRYSVSLSLRSWSSWKSSCPTWYVVSARARVAAVAEAEERADRLARQQLEVDVDGVARPVEGVLAVEGPLLEEGVRDRREVRVELGPPVGGVQLPEAGPPRLEAEEAVRADAEVGRVDAEVVDGLRVADVAEPVREASGAAGLRAR